MSRETLHWVNLRRDSTNVTDGTNQQGLGNASDTNFPLYSSTTLTYGSPVSDSFSAGTDSATYSACALRTRSTSAYFSGDARMCGYWKSETSVPLPLRIELSQTGTWEIQIGAGCSAVEGMDGLYVEIWDGVVGSGTLKDTIAVASSTSIGEFYDIEGTLYTGGADAAANQASWAAGTTGRQYEFSSTTLGVKIGKGDNLLYALNTIGLRYIPSGAKGRMMLLGVG